MLTPNQFTYELDAILDNHPSKVASAVRLRHHNEAQAQDLERLRSDYAMLVAVANRVTQENAKQAQRIRELEVLFKRHSGREKAMAEIVFQHIKHGDEAHQEWLRRELVEVLCREDTKSCITFDEMKSKILEREAELAQLEARVNELEAEVKEWLCDRCDAVYPGPPTAGFDCVQCPICWGSTGPRVSIELRRVKAELARLKGM